MTVIKKYYYVNCCISVDYAFGTTMAYHYGIGQPQKRFPP